VKERHPDVELSAYAAGDLGPQERAQVERHLAGCAACSATAADYRRLLHHLATSPAPTPEIAWPRYRAELRARRERLGPTSARARWLRPIPVAVSTAFVAACAIIVFALAPVTLAPTDLTSIEYDGLASRMEMIDHYQVVEQLDLLEDLDVIRNLDRLTPTREG
jgi:anti-sigma factor RsiW